MLNDRLLQAVMGFNISSLREVNKSCLWIADMSKTKSRKFGYADWIFATRCPSMDEPEEILTEDLQIIGKCFCKWIL